MCADVHLQAVVLAEGLVTVGALVGTLTYNGGRRRHVLSKRHMTTFCVSISNFLETRKDISEAVDADTSRPRSVNTPPAR